MSAPVLVTGATGFLGHTLCPYLVARGYRLRAFVRTSSDCEFLRPLEVELAWGDIRDPEAARAAVEGCRAVVHDMGCPLLSFGSVHSTDQAAAMLSTGCSSRTP